MSGRLLAHLSIAGLLAACASAADPPVMVEAPQPVLALIGTPTYARDPASAGALGAGGTEEWRFSAIRTGVQALSFEYRRPWERDTRAERTISFSVAVR